MSEFGVIIEMDNGGLSIFYLNGGFRDPFRGPLRTDIHAIVRLSV